MVTTNRKATTPRVSRDKVKASTCFCYKFYCQHHYLISRYVISLRVTDDHRYAPCHIVICNFEGSTQYPTVSSL